MYKLMVRASTLIENYPHTAHTTPIHTQDALREQYKVWSLFHGPRIELNSQCLFVSEMYSWQAKEEDEEEVEDGDLLGLTGGKSLTIFLVEATKAMGESREGDPDEYSALQVKYWEEMQSFNFAYSEIVELCPRYNKKQDIQRRSGLHWSGALWQQTCQDLPV